MKYIMKKKGVNDIKIFITVDMKSEDVDIDPESKEVIPNEELLYLLDVVHIAISKDVPSQLKITNLPPRRSGFIKASELNNIEGGD